MLDPDIRWHVYKCPPIDHWNGAVGIGEYLLLLEHRGQELEEIDCLIDLFESAVNAVASWTSWEGDGEWWLGTLPDVKRAMMWNMFLVKQRTEGTTFIASMVELPWLEEWRRHEPRAEPLHKERLAAHIDRVRELARHIAERRLGIH